MLTLSEASFRCKRLLRIRHWRERRWERYLDPELRAEVRGMRRLLAEIDPDHPDGAR
jgi:hypothetical protein